MYIDAVNNRFSSLLLGVSFPRLAGPRSHAELTVLPLRRLASRQHVLFCATHIGPLGPIVQLGVALFQGYSFIFTLIHTDAPPYVRYMRILT